LTENVPTDNSNSAPRDIDCSAMLVKLGLLALAATVPLSVAADEGFLFLRKEPNTVNQEADTNVLFKLLERIESLDAKLNKQAEEFGMRIDELEDTIEILQATRGRHLVEDAECVIKYNSATGMCHTNHTFAFDHHIEIMDGVTVSGEAEFTGKIYMMDGAEVRGGTLWSDGAAMFTKGMEVRGGLVAFNTTTRMGNLTVDGTTIVGKTTFMDPVDFKDSVCFDDDVEFKEYVHFTGDEEVDFYVDVTFKSDVLFEDDAEFHDDVAILGPTTSDDSEDSSIDFQIKGYVNVDFKQKLEMDVYPQTRFRDDVSLVHGASSSDSSTSSSTTTSSGSSDSSDSDDYSSESYDTVPQLIVAGDLTVETNLIVEGTSTLHGALTVSDDLTVTGTTELAGLTAGESDLGAVAADSLVVEGATELQGTTTSSAGGLRVENGNVQVDNGNVITNAGSNSNTGGVQVNGADIVVDNGNIEVKQNTDMDMNGDVTIKGNLVVDGTVNGV
jgi:hypothetical protein